MLEAATEQQAERKPVVFQVRLSKSLHSWLAARAKKNDRTRNREMVQILKTAQQMERMEQ